MAFVQFNRLSTGLSVTINTDHIISINENERAETSIVLTKETVYIKEKYIDVCIEVTNAGI